MGEGCLEIAFYKSAVVPERLDGPDGILNSTILVGNCTIVLWDAIVYCAWVTCWIGEVVDSAFTPIRLVS